ncbi:hypothetical protein C9374_011956 [Naegleria lovaniensis]|uniref:ABC1 atypical kinase-like domain-containing protein n=1 Tax=Naegleria lovaniensis TaxID=51637 RepID=A0AA88G993_NAELO|nr:uncharacterized protein C9374_011956 [Naegleria lovaniensis]KAG2373667.1 hypothetical protein C9374_011956 [Naegleria lovaniensis]
MLKYLQRSGMKYGFQNNKGVFSSGIHFKSLVSSSTTANHADISITHREKFLFSLFTSNTCTTTSFRQFSQSFPRISLDNQKMMTFETQEHQTKFNTEDQSSNSNEETKKKGFSFLKFLKKLIKYMTLSVASVMGLLAVCLPPGLMVDFKEELEKGGYRAVLAALLDAYKDTWNILTRFTQSCYSIVQVMTIYRNLNKDFEPKFENISKSKSGDDASNSSEEELQVLRDYVKARREANAKAAEILLDLCLKNGGAYVKAGQYIASLNYIMPKEITDILSVLQDKCQQHDFSVTETILLEDLDRDYREVFSSFDTTPIASASIAQVHKATLRDGNQTVAVKIQHPNLMRIFKADLKTMQFLLFSTKLFFDFPFAWTLPEFERILLSELDFVNEAANCSHFSQMFKDYPDHQIDAPRVHWNLTSKRILTMDFIEGCKINDLQALERMNIDPKDVAKLLVDSYSIQTFIHGFVHSDIHVGNLLVRRSDKNKPQLIYLDHGCYKKLDEETRKDYCQLWKAAIFRDHDNLKLYTEKFGIEGRFYPLFGLFLTFSNYMDKSSSSMVDQRKNMTSEEAKKMFKQIRETFFPKSTHKAQDLFNIIEEMFKNMKLDLILLMRANVQLRSITRELGRPINRFAVMAEYCLKGIHYERHNYDMTCIPHREADQRQVQVTHIRPTSFFHQLTVELFKFKLSLFVLDLAFVFFNLSMSILRYFNPSKYEEAQDDRETSHAKRRLERMKQKKAMDEDVASSKEDIEDLSAQK